MHILITGGTGFIGRALCRSLLAGGHRLTVLSRQPPERVRASCGDGVAVLASLRELTPQAQFDAVVNLAGESIAAQRWTEARKKILWDSRVTLTAELVDRIAADEAKPAVLVSGSAVGYYGNRDDTPLNEDATPADDFSHRLCAAWEQAALRAAECGVRVCLLRTGLVIGRDGGFLQRLLPPFRLGLGGPIGNGRQWMSWIHRDDHLALTQYLLEHTELSGAFNATAPNPVTNAEFSRGLGRLLHRPALLPLPAPLLRLAFGEMAELLLGGQRVLPQRLLQAGFQFRYPALEQALAEALGR
jgi:uncharacterized protein (TIGR01777 family)